MTRLLATATILALGAAPIFVTAAEAQPANLRPTRDVTVAYRMTMAGAPPQEMQMAFSPSTGKQRVDMPGNAGWMLIDRQANTATMVMEAQRATMAMPPATVSAMTQEAPAGATFTRKATATVAGQSCTEWEMVSGQVRGTSCFTDDGVLLRSVGTGPNGASVTMEATQVTYGAVDPAKLTLPSGYTAMPAPGQAPGGAAPGARPAR
ncbi:DUF4412 domain-containing protein [Pseudoroseomonas cervicalis]|uniref:DUF4412 domain-containing protein n=1 Tax=Teichococcus cervicalis TaxID=204525 RepID=UPI0022F1DDB1|nr:DUF4412 domain-containing protein [Pseudoroseomonas cervicalis]WBV45494.1 DUF4412 domain-containing protein [Pseudoroseomonas cervicalis]